jgi:sulfur relay (sulfurtransferase) complex TusBCD TusD component (DsrE family)
MFIVFSIQNYLQQTVFSSVGIAKNLIHQKLALMAIFYFQTILDPTTALS